MKACLYEALEDQVVRCHLCHHHCLIKPGHRGICQVRFNDEGRLFSMVYGRLIARHVDPIEKSLCFIFSRAAAPTPSLRWDATSVADFARMRTSRRCPTTVMD